MPENIEELFIRDALRVIVYLYGLCVVSQAVVRRVLLGPSRIAHPGADNSWDAPEPGVRAPESAQGERCRLDP